MEWESEFAAFCVEEHARLVGALSLYCDLYAANFGSHNKTYGILGAVIVFLVWLYISNNALLLGAEFNAEMERQRELKQGPTQRRKN